MQGNEELVAGRYRLVRVLGEGGMAIVWEAMTVDTGERVAVKLLKSATDGDGERRLAREARVISALNHPNLVRVRDLVRNAEGKPGIVMDLLIGETLGARVHRAKRLDVQTTARILLQVISAVGSAHQRGVIHRDLKPDNIFLQSDTDVRVLDFGIVKLLGKAGLAATSNGALTGTGAFLGTPYYMSPEQVFGEKGIDARTDVWSLGVVLYECLTGARPFDASNIGHLLNAISRGKFAPIESLAPEVPKEICALSMRMLAIERADRAKDLRDAYSILRDFTDTTARTFTEATPSEDPAD